MAAVETYFVANALAYPFLDKAEFLQDMEGLYRHTDSDSETPEEKEAAVT